MKKIMIFIFLLFTILTNALASQLDLTKQSDSYEFKTKPLLRQERFSPTYNFAIEPVTIGNNYYDYFPGSYSGKPLQKIQTPTFEGHWLLYHSKPTVDLTRRVYKALIDHNGNVEYFDIIDYSDRRQGFPAVDLTSGGRPLYAYHANLDSLAGPELEVGFSFDSMDSSLIDPNYPIFPVIKNPLYQKINGTVSTNNEYIWPSVQIASSPIAGHQRVYILGINSRNHAIANSENVIIFYKDFTEEDIENHNFDYSDWPSTTIPQLDTWHVSQDEWRRPFMSFLAYEDKIYYIGYHDAYTGAGPDDIPIDEPCLTVFICDNYGQGDWVQFSSYGKFASMVAKHIDPETGEFLDPQPPTFPNDLEDSDLSNSLGVSPHFSAAIDSEGRIHFPAFYTLNENDGYAYQNFHTVKNITFDTNTLEWSLAEVYPQQENGSEPFIPNDPIDITQYNNTIKYPKDALWQWWDKDGDGLYDEVLDDGTWDGIDDGVSPQDVNLWGKPILTTILPYMHWDLNAADNAMTYRLHTAQITNANAQGMMAMVWQDAQKAQLANLNYENYPEYLPYQNMCEIVISVSADNGRHWSHPIFLNGINTPEMQDEIPEFPYLGSEIDYLGEDEFGNPIGRLHLFYLDDDTYGSSVQGIGQSTGGQMKYLAIDVTFNGPPLDNSSNDVLAQVGMLKQNYPNPFNPTTTILYNVVKSGDVKLTVYNVKGQLVKTLVNTSQSVGLNSVVWQGDDKSGNKVSSGLYFYKIENAGRSEIKKMVLMK